MLAAGAFFALEFDTFIPQHTGVTRIGGYGYLLAGLGIALAVELALRRVARRRSPGSIRISARGGRGLLRLLGGAGGRGLAGGTQRGRRGRPQARPRRARARALTAAARSLTNVSTRGVIEQQTGLEDPVEGRQPVIEDPAFLDAANMRLAQVQEFFVNAGEGAPGSGDVLSDLDVRFVLAASDPDELGSPYHFADAPGLAQRLAPRPRAAAGVE